MAKQEALLEARKAELTVSEGKLETAKLQHEKEVQLALKNMESLITTRANSKIIEEKAKLQDQRHRAEELLRERERAVQEQRAQAQILEMEKKIVEQQRNELDRKAAELRNEKSRFESNRNTYSRTESISMPYNHYGPYGHYNYGQKPQQLEYGNKQSKF